ncbi:hypothetical protein Pcar_0919 [Syntrophotalea carbinolica DSM 2380]|uniref:Uncharacterized protein n=1 Tax=Syntrophotalea carbinolica (strain DSM 2380 / NBRC 103641 / GraBd1) TaxID=338963 RepID=Q3A635_SYNC1|nr:hypothetical protein Pcar_0919 [Syntrophotalea carbinolica DSM 2380]
MNQNKLSTNIMLGIYQKLNHSNHHFKNKNCGLAPVNGYRFSIFWRGRKNFYVYYLLQGANAIFCQGGKTPFQHARPPGKTFETQFMSCPVIP